MPSTPPVPSTPELATETTPRTPDETLTRAAFERGWLARDPLAALASASAVVWQHGGVILRPLTGTIVALAEDLRLPLDATDLVLTRALVSHPGAVAPAPIQTWDEHFGLGPASARCTIDAACDADGRVLAWREDGRRFTVAWDGAHPSAIALDGHAFVALRYDAGGLVELRAGHVGTTAPPETWPWRVGYTRDAAGHLEVVDAGGSLTRYAWDAAGRLVAITRGAATTRIGYDRQHRVVTLDGPGALATKLTWAAPAAGLRADVSVSDALGQATRFTWSTPSSDNTSEVRAGAGPRAARWVFDQAGRLLVHALAGAETRFTWDSAARLIAVRHPDGLTQELTRTFDGRLAAIVESPRTVAFTLTARGDIASVGVSDQDRETWTWSADPAPRLTRIAHSSGRFEAFTRDAQGHLARFENSAGAATDYRYDDATGRLASTRDEHAVETTYAYDARGRLAGRSTAGVDETWAWDAEGRISEHSEAGRKRRLSYDEAGRLTRVALPDGDFTWTFDALGRTLSEASPVGTTRYTWRGADLVAIERPSGARVTRELDAFGRLVRETSSDGARRELTWAAPGEGGRLAREAIAGGLARRFTWDPLGRIARIEEDGPAPGAARDLRFRYGDGGALELSDALSHATWTFKRLVAAPGAQPALVLSSASLPSGAVESYTRDARGHLREKTSSLGGGFTLAYDALGRPVTSTSAAGTTRFTWTANGQLAAMAPEGSPDAAARRFTYDPSGRLSGVAVGDAVWRLAYTGAVDFSALVDPAGRRTTFTHDERHRLASRTTPESGTITYAYDDAGRIASEQRGQHLHTFVWDANGQLARHDVDGAPVRTLARDDAGRVTSDTGADYALSFAFDEATKTRTTSDAARQVSTTRARDPGGHTLRLDVDGRPLARYVRSGGRLNRVEGPADFAVALDHDTFGRRAGLRLPGGAALRYKYDAAQRLIGIELAGPSGPTFTATFAYDAAGRLTHQSVQDKTLGYAYDDQGRLAATTLPDGATRAYGWSPSGELVRIAGAEIQHDSAGRPIAGDRAYDAAGRVTRRPGPETLGYDARGRLTQLAHAAAQIAYTYDGDGRVRSRSDGGAMTRFIWDGDALVELRGPAGTLRQIPGEGAGERFGFIDAGGARYLVQGPDGSTLAVVDGAGKVLMTYLHDPFGAPLVAEGSAPDALAYRGRFADPATGLVHFPMRWYDPAVGAFTAPDPDAGDAMDPATLARYAYLRGDPVNHIDPLGAEAYEWGPGSCLDAACKLFQAGKIKAAGSVPDSYSYFGAVEKQGWVYDVWSKRVPGSDRILTIFRDLNERSEGHFQGAGLTDNIVLNPDGPRTLGPGISATSAAPTPPAQPGFFSRVGSTVRSGYEQAKIGVQLYGKEITGTIGGLGGLSGTLGTSVGTLAVLPGGAVIIGAGVTVAGFIGYGAGTLINMIPGVSDGTQALINAVMGYEQDQIFANRDAQSANEGPKAKEHAEQTIKENLGADTMPQPPEPGVAGGTVNIGEVPPPTPSVAPDTAKPDEAPVKPSILTLVMPKKIDLNFTWKVGGTYGGVTNVVSCKVHMSFWNVGAMVEGYGAVSLSSVCTATLGNQGVTNTQGSGTFSGGPNGVFNLSNSLGSSQAQMSGGVSVTFPKIGTFPLPEGAFADWPSELPR